MASLSLISCGKDGDQPLKDVQQDYTAPLSFRSDPENGMFTKGGTPVTDASLRTSHMGLYAYWTPTGDYFSGGDPTYLYLKNREVIYSNTEGGIDYWVCTPTAYWPLGANLTFFGYAPYMANHTEVLDFPLAGSGMPRGHFRQRTAVDNQMDLCLSAPVYDTPRDIETVDLSLSHALTKVLFYFNLSSGKYDGGGTAFMIKSMTLSEVVGENTFTFGGSTGYTWDNLPRSDLSSRTASYTLSIADGTLSYTPLPYAEDRESETGLDKFECVNGEDAGVLYLLPQPMTGISKVTVVVSAYNWNAVDSEWIEDENGQMDPIEIYLPEMTVWKKGKTVAYSASVNASIPVTFSVTMLDWEMTTIEDVGFNHS